MKKPAREPVDMLRQERTEQAEEVRNIIDSAVQRILGDPAVWVEEASREGAPPLPWPCSMRGKGFAQLMGMVFDTAVENVLQAIEDDLGAQWAPPRDTADEDFQRVLQHFRLGVPLFARPRPPVRVQSVCDIARRATTQPKGTPHARSETPQTSLAPGFPQTALPLPEFKLQTNASETRLAKKYIPTADLWIQDPLRITTHTLTYRPGHPEFTQDPEGSPALNMWREGHRPASAASVEPFLRHIEYLVPIAGERERFLDWLAHIEQFPGVLPHTHYLMVASQTGIGRNWLASLLTRVWTGATRLGFDLVGTMQSGFNGALSRRLLVIVDELKAADTGYGSVNHAQQLKAMLTTEHRSINPKFGRQHIEYNCARWLMLSQHHDALPLERNDRRVIVVTNPQERKAPDHYAHLYALLDDVPFVAGVGQWLGARDIRRFNPSEPAPLSAAKSKAIDACVGDVERALIDLRDGTDDYVMTASQITDHLAGCGLARLHSRA